MLPRWGRRWSFALVISVIQTSDLHGADGRQQDGADTPNAWQGSKELGVVCRYNIRLDLECQNSVLFDDILECRSSSACSVGQLQPRVRQEQGQVAVFGIYCQFIVYVEHKPEQSDYKVKIAVKKNKGNGASLHRILRQSRETRRLSG